MRPDHVERRHVVARTDPPPREHRCQDTVRSPRDMGGPVGAEWPDEAIAVRPGQGIGSGRGPGRPWHRSEGDPLPFRALTARTAAWVRSLRFSFISTWPTWVRTVVSRMS